MGQRLVISGFQSDHKKATGAVRRVDGDSSQAGKNGEKYGCGEKLPGEREARKNLSAGTTPATLAVRWHEARATDDDVCQRHSLSAFAEVRKARIQRPPNPHLLQELNSPTVTLLVRSTAKTFLGPSAARRGFSWGTHIRVF
ncbi:hypothetical protein B2J93_3169 [Marssonina coronariae]|uniref:Uncharacterized protein n=1 Tax=Diplocarpon coronariae TaxID=2795749 RepID=A0A218Z2R7_9HELO|nr:hypothetical protein B2J93_3169 [Marssonina coronariae]